MSKKTTILMLLLAALTSFYSFAQDANILVRGVGVDIWNVNGKTDSPNQLLFPVEVAVRFENRAQYSTLGQRHFWQNRPSRIVGKDYATTPIRSEDARVCSMDSFSADEATTITIAVPINNMNVAGWTRLSESFNTSIKEFYLYSYDYNTPGTWVDFPYYDREYPTIIFGEEFQVKFDNPPAISELGEGVLIEDKMIEYNRKDPGRGNFYSFDAHFMIHPNGDYIAGRNGARFISTDKGETWSRLNQESYNIDHASTFYHNGDLYIIGDEKGFSNTETLISRSTDGGRTWSNPVGLEFNGRNSPSNVKVSRGRIWLAVEDDPTAIVQLASAPEDSNLLNPDSWSVTARPDNPSSSPRDDSEPVMAIGRDGWPIAFSILEAPVKASSATRAVTMFNDNEFRLPSRSSKFDVKYDAVSDKYWAMTSYSPIDGNRRTGLTLFSSDDLKTWTQERVAIQGTSTSFHGFQYPSFQFEGDDIVFVSRTAYENEWGQAQRWHDSNMLTFHRIRDFRGEGGNSCSLIPYANVNGEGWASVRTVSVEDGDAIRFGPQSNEFGADASDWSWTGPNNFTASGREVLLENVQAGIYTVSNTDENGCTATLDFTVQVAGQSTVQEGRYFIRNVATGEYLDSDADGAVGQVRSSSGTDKQWNLVASTEGFFYIDNALDDRGPLTANPELNSPITYRAERFTGMPFENREWQIDPAGPDSFTLLCKDAARGYITAVGNDAVQNSANGNDTSARWELVAVNTTTSLKANINVPSVAISMHPNPTRGGFTVDMSHTQMKSVDVFSMAGQKVYNETLENATSQFQIEESLVPGVYLVRLTDTEGKTVTKKIIVE